MKDAKRMTWIAALAVSAILSASAPGFAQKQVESDMERDARLARRGGGLRAGIWNDNIYGDAYFHRGLDKHFALENSVGVTRAVTTIPGTLGAADGETKSYIVPILTSLKAYPLTTRTNRIEPFIHAGAGFALGIEDEGRNAIGGGGTSIVTGFGFKGGAGVECHIGSTFGIAAGTHYMWIRFGDALAGKETFEGVGFTGGLTYRFQF